MLINISSNSVYISYQWNSLEIPRGGLEIELPKILKQLHDDGCIGWRICVINGPGSFTNLRVWCLCINMFKSISNYNNHKEFGIYTIDKVKLFVALHHEGIIGPRGLIYIGQQKNGRSYDIGSDVIEKTSLWDRDSYDRIDEMSACDDERMLRFSWNDEKLSVMNQWTSVFYDPLTIGFEKVELLVPNYMMEPNIQGK
jgi:hypothetical protein